MFLRDDGFGPEVARVLATDAALLRPGVRAVDYGIRGMHLAYDLLERVDALILVDTVPAPRTRGGNGSESPHPAAEMSGTIRVLEVRSKDLQNNHDGGPPALDPHGMDPVAVLGRLTSLGGGVPLTFVVGCVPGDLSEGIGLSPAVAAAIPEALSAIGQLIEEITERLPVIRRNGPCAWEFLAG